MDKHTTSIEAVEYTGNDDSQCSEEVVSRIAQGDIQECTSTPAGNERETIIDTTTHPEHAVAMHEIRSTNSDVAPHDDIVGVAKPDNAWMAAYSAAEAPTVDVQAAMDTEIRVVDLAMDVNMTCSTTNCMLASNTLRNPQNAQHISEAAQPQPKKARKLKEPAVPLSLSEEPLTEGCVLGSSWIQ